MASSALAASMVVCRDSPSNDGVVVSGRLSMVYCNRASLLATNCRFALHANIQQSARQCCAVAFFQQRRPRMGDSQEEHQDGEQRSSPSGAVVYHAISKEGEDELSRSTSALAWSGLAAGLSMGFSMVAQGLLRAHLPDTSWQPLVASFGYSVGFLIVVLGRQQLFTENTLTVILPLLQKKDGRTLRNVARLWTTVLLANLAGALAFAFVAARTTAFDPGIGDAFVRIGQEGLRAGFATTLLRGV